MVVRGNLDNAEPLFVIGGTGNKKTHYFENVISVENEKLIINDDLKNKLKEGYLVGLLEGDNFSNENEIKEELKPVNINTFFKDLKDEVKVYYEGTSA